MKQRLYDFIPVKHLCVGMSLCGIVAGTQTAQASRLRAIIGLRTSESQHLPTKYETDFRYRQRPGGDSCNWRERDRKRDDKRSNHRARWRFPTGSSGKRYLRDQLYRLYDAKYPDKRENDLQHHPRRRYAEIG